MTPVKETVVGVWKESVQFQWILNRGNEKISVASVGVYNGPKAETKRQLFSIAGQKVTRLNDESDRLNITIVGDVNDDIEVTYNLTLKDIQFDDKSVTFYLSAIFRPLVELGAAITLVEVNGTHFSSGLDFARFLCSTVIFGDAFLKFLKAH